MHKILATKREVMSSQNKQNKLTSIHIQNAKGKDPLVMLTAYDYPSALLADAAGVDMILVGDSLGMVMLGYEDTLSVDIKTMLHHCKAVSRANTRALVVCDMPFMSYEDSVQSAVRNAGKLMAKGGARAVKLEGGMEILPQVKALVQAGIPVMGHIGLTPQRVATLGGYRIQGRTANAAYMLLEHAKALQDAGCFSIVLECIPEEVATLLTNNLNIPTIGIGAGNTCDGQVLVWHDMLGLNTGHVPKFVKKYSNIGENITKAIQEFSNDVRGRKFPQAEHSTYLNEQEAKDLDTLLKGAK